MSTTAASLLPLATKGDDSQRHRIPVIDAHVHCFAGLEDERFPYHPKGPYRPEKAATPERLLELMDAASVDYAVIVHPEPYQDDHQYLDYCLSVGGGRLKGVCHFFADEEESTSRMANLVRRHPREIVAVRIHAYAPERLAPLGKPELRSFWKDAADLGLAVQIHFEPRYAPAFEPLIREFKDTTVIVDHLGRPFQGTQSEHDVVLGWAKYSHVMVKLSGIPVKEQYPHRDPAPVVKEIALRFGPDRLLYGGGFGADATAASYRAARERIEAYLPDYSVTALANVLGGNTARLFNFAD